MRVPVMPDGFPRAGWILRAGGAVALLLGCALSTAAGAQTPRAGTDASAPEDPRLRQYLPPVPSVHPYMKGDQRLSKKVTMASADVTMSELLAELSKQTGIPLSAAKEVAEDAVTAGFRERPLAEVLALLSTHFGFTWRKKANGYEIWQDLRSLQREQLLRERENWELIARGIELGRLARRATPEARERRMEELRSPGTAPTAAMSPADLREHMDLNAVQGSGGTALAALAGLPQLRLQQLARADVVRLSTGDGSLAPAIAAELERLRMKKQPAAAVNRARPAPARWEVLLEVVSESGSRGEPSRSA